MKKTAALTGAVLTLLGRTWRLEWEGNERLAEARRQSPRGNVIYAFWHGSLAILAHTHRHRDIQVLVSRHRDGEVIARMLARQGYGLVRGSTQRGGLQALFGLARAIEAGRDVGVTVDGPVGPRYHVRAGVLLLARRTGCPIVPVIPTADRCLYLPTWDALRVPLPWASVRVQHGEPLWIARSTPPASLPLRQRELEAALLAWTRAEEERWGRSIDLRDVQDRRSWLERRSERAHPPWSLRVLAHVHGAARHVDRTLRRRPHGRGTRPWVVGIGNLEAGGTGKTPCVVTLGHALTRAGLRVGVLTRGYGGTLGRRSPELLVSSATAPAADETRLLAEALGARVPIVVSRDKRRGLEMLRGRRDLDVVLVDDALQTVGLAVDRHLVLLDWELPLGNGWLLPAGRLREPAAALRRAHALLFTRARDGVPRHPAWAHLPPERCFLARETLLGLRRPEGTWVEPVSLAGQGVVLLSGLGRPQAFEASAAALASHAGFAIRRSVRVGDHADLLPALRKLRRLLARLECTHVLVSRKDLLRLPPAAMAGLPLLVLEQQLDVEGVDDLLRLLVPAYDPAAAAALPYTETEA